mmetsp:Transcript_32164/g.49178  ORF Transcript_32164/g.49178 Transcript_32164/m.49178 type:complete len:273 (-) Transcript_32164:66-884(-)
MFLVLNSINFVVRVTLQGLFRQKVGVLLVWVRSQFIVSPQFRTQVSIGTTECIKESLDKVTHGTGMTTGTGVAIVDSSHVQQLFSGGRRHQSRTTGCRNQSHTHGTTLSLDLAGHGMGQCRHTSPVSTADGTHVELGRQNGTANGIGHLGGTLDAQSNVSVGITHGNKGLESSALTGTGLLLHGHDFHDFVLELVLEKEIDNFGLLDGKTKQKDFFHACDASLLDQTSEFGDGDPSFFFAASAAAVSPAAVAAAASAASAKASSFSSSSTFS